MLSAVVALRATGGSVTYTAVGLAKVMVCARLTTLIVFVKLVAAFQFPFPACVATSFTEPMVVELGVNVHGPPDDPLNVAAVLGVITGVSVMGKFELAVAVSVIAGSKS